MALDARLAVALALSLWSTSVVACGGDDDAALEDAGAPDGGADAALPTCDGVDAIPVGDATGHPDPLGAAVGEARAGRLTESTVPVDPTGLGTVAIGDFVLANSKVALVIEDVGFSDIYDPWGGKIVGLGIVEDGRIVLPADFEEALVGLGLYTLETTSVSVVADGSGGGAAIVRATGTLAPLPVIDELLGAVLPGRFDDVPAAIDYVLAPDAERASIVFTVENRSPSAMRVPIVLHGFIQANRMPPWAPNVGFELRATAISFIAFVNDDGAGYAWWSADGDLQALFSDTGFSGLTSPEIEFEPCATTARPLASIVVGATGLDGLLEAVARERGTTTRAIGGRVLRADGSAADGVRVHATAATDGTHLTRVTTEADGSYELHVPGNVADVDVVAYAPGIGLSPSVRAAGDSAAVLTLPQAGTVHVTARDIPPDTPLPVRVQVVPVSPAPPLPDAFGELREGNGRLHIAYPIDGDVTLSVAVGEHRVIVSHGYEYEMLDRMVSVAANATVDVAASLERVVDTSGVMCGDFHIHSHRSLDSADEHHMKVASGVADGVEVLVRSEHEWIADYEPVIAELGLGAWAFGISSEELSSTVWGHFGVFPLTPNPDVANAGAFEWAYMNPTAVFAAVHARPEDPALIINHPRSRGKGYFQYVGYDPATGMVERPDEWDDSFTLLEVFNDSDFESNRDETVRDWLSFLSRGQRVFAVGSSDSHRASTNPIGYPRTCLALGSDDPRALTPDRVRDVLESGAATVSGGIYIDAHEVTTMAGPGDTASGVGATATISVRVQAASWVDVQRLEIIVDGTTVATMPIDETTVDPMRATTRFSADLEIDVSDGPFGSYIIFAAHGDDALDPVHPGKRPFGVTNPIFLAR